MTILCRHNKWWDWQTLCPSLLAKAENDLAVKAAFGAEWVTKNSKQRETILTILTCLNKNKRSWLEVLWVQGESGNTIPTASTIHSASSLKNSWKPSLIIMINTTFNFWTDLSMEEVAVFWFRFEVSNKRLGLFLPTLR